MTLPSSPEPSLAGRRILVVEDEYFIATDLKRMLVTLDAEVVGPVGDVARGLDLARGERLDAAILDVNLEGESSYEIADELIARDVPHAFVTGYDGWSMPKRYQSAPRITKPFAIARIAEVASQLCAGRPPS